MQTQPSPKPFSLKDVPSKRFTELKNLVNTSNGRVIIIMHPYYAEQTSGYNQKYYEKYLRVIEGIIKQTRIPIIILEGRPGIIKKRLGENISSKKNVFCFPSYDDHENIVEDAYKQDLITRSDSKKLIEILTKAGVREVQLGGSFFGRKHSPEVFAH